VYVRIMLNGEGNKNKATVNMTMDLQVLRKQGHFQPAEQLATLYEVIIREP
jgi:hypothetical protein